MRNLVPIALVVLVATLTLSGIGRAQDVTIRGTIQAVDCKANTLVVKGADGTQYSIRVSPSGSNSTVFVNSAPVSFCTLQQYIGSHVTVSVASNGDQLMVRRVDVNATAAAAQSSGPSQGPPLITGMPKWAEVALGLVLVGALIYIGTQKHSPPPQSQPSYQCPDGSWRQVCP